MVLCIYVGEIAAFSGSYLGELWRLGRVAAVETQESAGTCLVICATSP